MKPEAHKRRRYFARVTGGLEQIAGDEIRRLRATSLEFGHRRIDFRYDGDPAYLLELHSVDDVYVYVAQFEGLDHTRASLTILTEQLERTSFAPALAAIREAREIPERPTYRVTASHLGKRNYSRFDVEAAAQTALARLPWRFVPNAPDVDEPDLDLRILLEEDWALVGLRLGATPLHRRAYKQASGPGSLKAPVAYALCMLAQIAPGDVVLDPACGAGTILAEASELARKDHIIGGDIDAAILAFANSNLGDSGLLYRGDATNLPLAAQSVDAVICNLPWGQQVAVEGEAVKFYGAVIAEVERVLKSRRRAVLLTDQDEAMRAAMRQSYLKLDAMHQISLYGRHPTIFVMHNA